MHMVDWLIVGIPLIVIAVICIKTQRYVKSVSDFLAGGRVAGRYIVCVAMAEAGMGLISIVGQMEMQYKSGYAIGFWAGFTSIIGLVIMLTGFAIYRYRETRAMTMAQFFEIRYSKRFRVFTGMLAAVTGIFNYGIFPAVSARFIIYYCDLPPVLDIAGWQIPTLGVVMLVFLSVALILVMLGGQITVMVSDSLQGLLSYPMYVAIFFAIICVFKFDHFKEALLDRPPGESFMNPFDTYNLRDFNLFYILVGVFGNIYNRMSWQGTQAYNASAINAHEQKMAGVLGMWRTGFYSLAIAFATIGGYTLMHHDDFAAQRQQVNSNLVAKTLVMNTDVQFGLDELQQMSPEQLSEIEQSLHGKTKQNYDAMRFQMVTPLAIRKMLPIG